MPNVNLVVLLDYCVSDFIIPGTRDWNVLLLQDLFDPEIVQFIGSIHLAQTISFDKWSWFLSPSGLFFC